MSGAPEPVVQPDDDALDVLACEWQKRPRGAPSFDDLALLLRAVERAGDTLVLRYAPGALAQVEALAAAERLCCSAIGFSVEPEPAPTLRIRATAAQLDIFEVMLRPS